MAISSPTVASLATLTARFGRWRGPGLAIVAGLALAFKPSLGLWSANAPWVLDVYQDIRLGTADLGLLILAAYGWLGPRERALPPAARALAWAGGALLASLAASILVAAAPQLAVAALVRCAIGLLAALAIAGRPSMVRWLLFGGFGALLVQLPFVILQLATQSTFPAGRLFDGWSREVTAATSGAAVIIGPNGLRWQRALGTFPHPNILGGFVAIGLVFALPHLLRPRGHNWRVPTLWAVGWLILLATLSRAALLAALLGCAIVALAHRRHLRRTFIRLTVAPLAALALLGALLGPILLDRFALNRAALASPSVRQRDLIADIAWQMIRHDPLRGVGAGNFTLAELRPPFNAASVDPAHAVPLLLTAEAGVIAGLAWVALLVAPLATEYYRERRIPFVRLAIPLALLTLALLDHYLWTFGPGRALFWLALGIWLAQSECNVQRSTFKFRDSSP